MKTYRLRTAFDPARFRVHYEAELNPAQLRVVQNGDGKVLVLAGAGSGKTRTIVYRVAYLLERAVRPEDILLVTFTNKASREMLSRIEALLGTYPKGLWGGTFHHVANLILRRTAATVGYAPSFTILDDEDSRDLLAVCVKDAQIETTKRRFPSTAVLQDIVSYCRNTTLPLEKGIEQKLPHFHHALSDIERVANAYEQRKRAGQLMDFDDLIVNLLTVLTDERVGPTISRRFRYILVDEYQDTNRLQATIVDRASVENGNLLVVGDDSQSIYAFRGADIGNILHFPDRHHGCVVHRLETNYRSTPEILALANDVIARNRKQFPKQLTAVRSPHIKPALVAAATPSQEAVFVAQRVLELRNDGIPLSDIAVLFRATHHSQALEFELTRRDIPYEYRGGVRFFERTHVKDVLAFLKIIANPTDEIAWHRALMLQVGIGSATASDIFTSVRYAADPLVVALETSFPDRFDRRGRQGVRNFQSTLDKLHNADPHKPATMIEEIIRGEYRLYLESQFPNAEERIADLEQFARFASRYDDLRRFLDEVSLQESYSIAGGGSNPQEDERLVLSTIHQAKGLEWEAVFLIQLTSSNLPNPKARTEPGGLEEERRLFYVAVTRAKRELSCSYPIASDSRGYGLSIASPSPFLDEVSPESFEPLGLEDDPLGSEATIDVNDP